MPENISHVVNPNDQTSDAVENSSDVSDSGAIHLQGTGVCEGGKPKLYFAARTLLGMELKKRFVMIRTLLILL